MDSGVCIIGKTLPPPQHLPKHFSQTLWGEGVNTLAKPPSAHDWSRPVNYINEYSNEYF